MSDKREILWVRTDPTTHFTAAKSKSFAANEIVRDSVNVASYCAAGDAFSEAFKYIRGRIRDIRVWMHCTHATGPGAAGWYVIVSSKDANSGTAPETNYWSDFELLTPWVECVKDGGTGTDIWFASINGLDIPVLDKDKGGNIHLGLQYTTGGNTADVQAKGVVFEIGYQLDAGE